MTKLVLASVAQLSVLIDNNPSLLTIRGLQPLQLLFQNVKANNSKGCSACQQKKSLLSIRPQVEKVLTSLQPADYVAIKDLLKVDQLCYYQRVNGTLTQTCV